MAVSIKPKRTSTPGNVPTTSDIEVGEIAINLADKKLYVRDASDNIFDLTESVTDTSPELGGDLDLNNNDIIGTGNIDIEGTITSTGNISTDGTIDGDVIGNQGYYAKASENISKGDVVMFNGAQGSHLLILKADMSVSGFLPEWIMGVASEDITLGNFGFITSFGKIAHLDTEGFNGLGDTLWVDPDTPGGLTNSKPTPPDHVILIAAILEEASNGSIQVRITHEVDTDEVAEGSTNLYYTDARVDSHLSGGTGVTYSSGTISIGQPVGTTNNVTFNVVNADLTGDVTGNVTGTVSSLSNHDTDDLSEGSTNQYYTDSRVSTYVSGNNTTADFTSLTVNSAFTFPTTDGGSDQILQTNGAGTVSWIDLSAASGVGYTNSSLSSFPTGDYLAGGSTETYVGESGNQVDAFGVSLQRVFDCMDPIGTTNTSDLGVLT